MIMKYTYITYMYHTYVSHMYTHKYTYIEDEEDKFRN